MRKAPQRASAARCWTASRRLLRRRAHYLDYRIDRELCRRKQIIVDSLMAAISECFKRKLEALDEGCDPTSGGSHPSSGSVQGIKSTSRSSAAGQKRSSRHGSRDESDNSEDDDSFRKKKDKKRARIEKDDTKPRFACPYHQDVWSEAHVLWSRMGRATSGKVSELDSCNNRFANHG